MRDRVCDLIARLALRLVARGLFRIRVLGAENVPSSGPALLVSNHLTHLDAFLIGCCVGPLVRFLVWKPYYDNPLLRWAPRLGGSIPVSAEPFDAVQAIRRARGELAHGQVICIFPEGSISRTGDLLPFQRGLEAIAQDAGVPVIPVYLGGLWESVFSYRSGRFFWKRPGYLRHPVKVSFGPPMSASSTASEVRHAVLQLRESVALTADAKADADQMQTNRRSVMEKVVQRNGNGRIAKLRTQLRSVAAQTNAGMRKKWSPWRRLHIRQQRTQGDTVPALSITRLG